MLILMSRVRVCACKGVFNFCVVGLVQVSHVMHGHVDHDGEGVGHMPSCGRLIKGAGGTRCVCVSIYIYFFFLSSI